MKPIATFLWIAGVTIAVGAQEFSSSPSDLIGATSSATNPPTWMDSIGLQPRPDLGEQADPGLFSNGQVMPDLRSATVGLSTLPASGPGAGSSSAVSSGVAVELQERPSIGVGFVGRELVPGLTAVGDVAEGGFLQGAHPESLRAEDSGELQAMPAHEVTAGLSLRVGRGWMLDLLYRGIQADAEWGQSSYLGPTAPPVRIEERQNHGFLALFRFPF